MSDKIGVSKIVLDIGGTAVELTTAQAKALYRTLHEMYGEKTVVNNYPVTKYYPVLSDPPADTRRQHEEVYPPMKIWCGFTEGVDATVSPPVSFNPDSYNEWANRQSQSVELSGLRTAIHVPAE